MKELIEEYGGIMLACFLGLLFLGMLSDLLDSGGGLSRIMVIFAEGIGSIQS